MLSRLIYTCLCAAFLSLLSGHNAFSSEGSADYFEQEREHLQASIYNADQLNDYIPEEEAPEYLVLIEGIATCKYSQKCVNAGEAAYLLGLLLSHGTFGPADINKAERYLQIAVDKYQKHDAANYLGWLYLDRQAIKNEQNAASYLNHAFEKGDPLTKYYSANNLGSYFLLSQKDHNIEKAAEFYATAVNIGLENELNEFLAAENLSRMLIYGNDVLPRDLVRAREYSQISEKNGGHSIFKKIVDEFPIDISTSHTNILIWLEELAASGETEALLELAYYAEFIGNKSEFLKWFNVCSIICERFPRSISNDKLSSYEQSSSTNELNFARKQAGEWFTSRYRPIENPKPNGFGETVGLTASGEFHALLIGVNEYSHPYWPKLTSPVADVKLLGGVLERRYGAKLRRLINPTKGEIVTEIRFLANTLTKDDSLMIYFGGHGHRSLDGRKGYWILTDGRDEETTWFDHDELKSIINKFDATNILIVSDSCFSGLLTANFKSAQNLAKEISTELFNKYLRTRSIMTYSSGGLEEVPDTGSGDNSIFAHQLSRFFTKQEGPFTISQLHASVSRVVAGEVRVKLNLRQRPQLGSLPFHGHIGPDFVFIPLQE